EERFLDGKRGWLLPLAIAAFLAIAMIGSKRNYGVRYLLPMAPLAIVWISALPERRGIWRWIVAGGLVGQAAALATIHPHELSYFNILAGGKIGGRKVLADSNLDWGQGLRSLAQLEKRYRPMTLFYFGDVNPGHYLRSADGFLITATGTPIPLPEPFAVGTRYVAVSASLQHGPWGPEGYFRALDGITPVAYTDDGTIAIYDIAAGAGRTQ
ncbi:MAG TPA: 4-amino-4-deoxy-L-arabinose transferase, partial [Isosphaeraceae bacterium]